MCRHLAHLDLTTPLASRDFQDAHPEETIFSRVSVSYDKVSKRKKMVAFRWAVAVSRTVHKHPWAQLKYLTPTPCARHPGPVSCPPTGYLES